MHRRAYIAAVTAGAGGVLAGCLGSSGLDREEVAVLDGWFQDAVGVVDEGQRRVSAWRDDPERVDLTAVSTLATDADALLTRWTDEVAPKLDGLRDTDIDRTVGNETWEVAGGEFADVLERLRDTVAMVRDSADALVAADGAPDQVGDEAQSTLDTLADEGRDRVDSALELWFRDTLG